MNTLKNLLFLIISTLCVESMASIHYEFKEPECLKSNIDFWEKVYIKYGRDYILFHDKNTMEIYLVENIEFKDRTKKRKIKNILDSLSDVYPSIEFRAQQGIKELFSDGMERSNKYLPMIMDNLESMDMPLELAYLPHVESSFNPLANSRVGAKGMWQIMSKTGKLYGMRNKSDLYDPYRATPIALRILKHNYEETGSWELAVMAYNHGLGGMKRAKSIYGNDICAITGNYSGRAFKFASRNFYSQFLAVQRIVKCRN